MDQDLEKGLDPAAAPQNTEKDNDDESKKTPVAVVIDAAKPTAAAVPKNPGPQQQQIIRRRERSKGSLEVQRTSRSTDGRDVIEVHHHHHHMHPMVSGGVLPTHQQWSTMLQDTMSDIYPMPIGAGTWANPITQQTYQQSTIQNNFTWILGWCVCCPTAAICIIIWLVVFGIFTWDQVFRSPWG